MTIQPEVASNTISLTSQQPPASFIRRMGAIFYDAVLLLAVLFFGMALLLPFNDGEAFQSGPLYYLVDLYLLTLSFFFYGWFWTHGGQTLGMRAWKLKVCAIDQSPIGWRQALLRFSAALLSWAIVGLGFLAILFNPERSAWHDRLSKTRIVRVE